MWFYEMSGQRNGPVQQEVIIELIRKGDLDKNSAVWKEGFSDWMKIDETELANCFDSTVPPPLSGQHLNNTTVWILAFAPLIGYFLEWVIASIISGGNEYVAEVAMLESKYWFVTLALNIGLSYADEAKLRAAGYNTEKFKGVVWLVPVYLFQRAKATKQNLAYFIVWLFLFVLLLLN